jgi:translation initiation factor IF-1
VRNLIRLVPGDEVECELSVYDPSRGRILHRGQRRGEG